MPKISTEHVTIFGKQHKYELWFNVKSSTFYANKLPEEFLEFLKEAKLQEPDSTERTKFVNEVLPAAIKKWETASVQERIVIAYKAQWGSRNVKAFSPGNDRWGSKGFVDEALIKLDFEVYKERSVNGVKKYYKRYRDWNHPLTDEPDEWDRSSADRYGFEGEHAIIDWTSEREASMKAIYYAIEDVARKFKKIIDVPDNFLKLLDSGSPLLEDKRDVRD